MSNSGGYGIITVMKNKKILFGTGLAGVGLLAAAGYTLTKKVTDYKRQQITQTLREFLVRWVIFRYFILMNLNLILK